VDDLGVRGRVEQQVHRATLVGLEVAEGDPAQLFQGDNVVDGLGHEREQLSHSGVEKERLVTGEQELVEGEPVLGDARDVGGQAIDVRPDFVDGGVHDSMVRRIGRQGRDLSRTPALVRKWGRRGEQTQWGRRWDCDS
jgi:hypothetical protein